MKIKRSIIDFSLLSDSTLKTVASDIVTTMTENPESSGNAFSPGDAAKAIGNFNMAVAAARNGDATAIAIRNLTKEALITVLNKICGDSNLGKKYRAGLN